MTYQTIIMWIAITLAVSTVIWTRRQLIQKNWKTWQSNHEKAVKRRKLNRALKIFDALSTSKSPIHNLKNHYNRINASTNFINGIINMTDERFMKNVESVIMGVLKREKLVDVRVQDEGPNLDIFTSLSWKDEEAVLGYGTSNIKVPTENKLIKMIPDKEEK